MEEISHWKSPPNVWQATCSLFSYTLPRPGPRVLACTLHGCAQGPWHVWGLEKWQLGHVSFVPALHLPVWQVSRYGSAGSPAHSLQLWVRVPPLQTQASTHCLLTALVILGVDPSLMQEADVKEKEFLKYYWENISRFYRKLLSLLILV